MDFTENSALQSLDKLQYSVPYGSGIVELYGPGFQIDTLYRKIQFDEVGEDCIEEDGHCYYAFKFTDADKNYTTLNAKVGAIASGWGK
ncbi:MAG: hypothetical protein IJS61_08895 [Firmicutes bacterium]|nr:hypothetical protein [Bacillota bacterium]